MKEKIVWSEIHSRIDETRKLIEQGFKPTAEEKKRILAERAEDLASDFRVDHKIEDTLQVVEFLLEKEHYSFEIQYIREILPLNEICLVPCTPDFIVGITSIRGQIISVMDMKSFFNLPPKGITDSNKLIILHLGEMEVGILVDCIFGERSVPVDIIQSDIPTLSGIGAEYLKGVTADGLIIIDAEKVLTDKKIIVNEEVE
ncbi:MAG: chemotaxis protein CheW [Spirochaetaceae bacterium]